MHRPILKMYLSAALLWMLMGGCSSKKKGDFGIFTACTKNNTLRLECIYAPCKDVPNFDCEFKDVNGTSLRNGTMDKSTNGTVDKCQYIFPGHKALYLNQTETYNCTLTRKGRREDKKIIITYRGKDRVKTCASAGLLLHEAPNMLWAGVFLLLWKILTVSEAITAEDMTAVYNGNI